MIQSFKNIWNIPELRRRVLYTLGLLAVYRIGGHIPTPGIDNAALLRLFEQQAGSILGYVDLFAGGNFKRFTIFALGIMPYITASIILQLFTVIWPYLEKLSKEGEAGRRKITQWTRYGTVLLSFIQSFGIAFWLESASSSSAGVGQIVLNPGMTFRLMTVLTLTTGHGLHHVARRADLRARHRQRHLPDHLRGDRRRLPERRRADDPRLADRRDEPDRDRAPRHRDGAGGRRHRLRRAGPAEDPDPVRAARRRTPCLRGGFDLSPAARQHGRRHPGHLRQLDARDPSDARQHRPPGGRRLGPGHPGPAVATRRRFTTSRTPP